MEDKIKEKHPHWVIRFLVIYLIFLCCYGMYLYFAMDVRISKKEDVQLVYGQYLVDMQDKMVEHSLNFGALVEDTERTYTETEKKKIEEELIAQNELFKEFQRNSPNNSNDDYSAVYKDILKIFSFYIQGETMQANYVYGYKDEYIADEQFADSTTRLETYTLGTSLCNMMGNMMLNNYRYVNDVRKTDYQSKYEIKEVDDLEEYLTPENKSKRDNILTDIENGNIASGAG